MKLFSILAMFLFSGLCFANVFGGLQAPEVYDPLDKPHVHLESKDGKTIYAQIQEFDTKRGLVKIRIEEQGQSMWFSPDLLSEASRAELEDWRMVFLINEFVAIRAERSNKRSAPGSDSKKEERSRASSGVTGVNRSSSYYSGTTFVDRDDTTNSTTSGARYDVELRNFSKEHLKDIKIRAITVVKSADGQAKTYSCVRKLEELSGTKTALLQTDAVPIVKKKTNSESTNKVYNSDGTYYVTGGSASVKSSRDSLKGLAIRLYYKDTVVQEWYSARSLEEDVRW